MADKIREVRIEGLPIWWKGPFFDEHKGDDLVWAVNAYDVDDTEGTYPEDEFFFGSEEEANRFMDDPLARDRLRSQRQVPEVDKSYIALGTRISTGRRVGRKQAR